MKSSPPSARAGWAKSGRELFYWSVPQTTLMSVSIQPAPFSAGAPRELFKMLSGTTWDVAPDGEHFLIEGFGTQGGAAFAVVTDWFDELRRRAPAR